jgi:hypothetical protein
LINGLHREHNDLTSLIFSLKEREIGYLASSVPFLVHNFNMKEQIFQKRPIPTSLGTSMGTMLITFPKSFNDVGYMDE